MNIQCTTCRYLDIEPNETPCNHCGNFNMWETQEYRTVEELEKIKEEIHSEAYCERTFGPTLEKPRVVRLNKIDEIINNHISELKGENNG